MTKVLVTGAKGMMGTDLCRFLGTEGYELLITDIAAGMERLLHTCLKYYWGCSPFMEIN